MILCEALLKGEHVVYCCELYIVECYALRKLYCNKFDIVVDEVTAVTAPICQVLLLQRTNVFGWCCI